VPAASLAVSNTPVESEAPGGASRTVVFKRTPPLPSYLLALAVGPFDTVPITGMSVPGRIVTVKGKGALAAEAARVTPPLLGALEKYFGRPYPFEKLDLLAVPEYWPGAMENPGASPSRTRSSSSTPRGERRPAAAADRGHGATRSRTCGSATS
jgi:alanyl aminopeptidase